MTNKKLQMDTDKRSMRKSPTIPALRADVEEGKGEDVNLPALGCSTELYSIRIADLNTAKQT